MTERRRDTFSAVLRGFGEMLNIDKAGLRTPRSPVLFSTFFDTRKITIDKTITFSVELTVSTTGYVIDNERLSEGTGTLAEQDDQGHVIAVSSKKGFKGRLRLTVQQSQ